jgi:hypothetical protein
LECGEHRRFPFVFSSYGEMRRFGLIPVSAC